ncbi:glycoside hydrolase family 35 protein [Paenibacillus taiwanensis]|uniref:glycoside hydrolase family 35 protein n=1 Tax=Paenibacillus taiwanensis TaxID=401638 RepID=UPI00048C353E|nr:beta-galactosidase family protein [Paenibacillus taiwanensis]
MTQLTWEGQQMLLHGKPFRIISGAMHYFRIVPEYWADRLRKLKAMGCNTVETYVAWNVHEPREGHFNFNGINDIAGFVRLAGEMGLYVIVRPTPYVCGEWEFGGLPAWLLNIPLHLRCSDPRYLAKVAAYYDKLIPLLTPLLSTQDGPIIAMQVENEYGSYGNDKAYLHALRDMLVERGVDVLLFTSDGPQDELLQGGMAEGAWATVNFGSRSDEAFDKLLEYQPDAPLMCMEFWNGWFDHWFEEHHTRSTEDAAHSLDEILARGASVNFYMLHGGTNFGFMNGANYGVKYEPAVTSYDYDAAINEAGDLTPKFEAFRRVIGKYVELPKGPLPSNLPKAAYGEVTPFRSVQLWDTLDTISGLHHSICPEPMEHYGQGLGFIMYSTTVTGPRAESQLTIQDVHDRALVFIDRQLIGVMERWHPTSLPVVIPEGGARLDILVENMGRVNYGPELLDCKGITDGVRLNNQFQFHWEVRTIPLESIAAVQFNRSASTLDGEQPAFYEAELVIEGEPVDTFLYLDNWRKGVVFINDFNLGRYWEAGPQRSLYVPAPLLRQGTNQIVVFELHAPGHTLEFRKESQL